MHDIRPLLPELFTEPGTLLYIGARTDAHAWLDEFIATGHTITVLEIWPLNVEGLQQDTRFVTVAGDVRNTDAVLPLAVFDYVIWWHGPEHVWESEIEPTLRRLARIADKLLAVASPYGIYEQGEHAGNTYETHVTAIYPSMLEWIGFETATDGEANKQGGEVVGWIRK